MFRLVRQVQVLPRLADEVRAAAIEREQEVCHGIFS